MGAVPGEQWQLLAAHQHVDRVDLDDAHPIECAPEVPAIHSTGWSWVGETLRRECDAASLGQREPFRCHVGGATDQSATAMVTELMTTGVRGRSL